MVSNVLLPHRATSARQRDREPRRLKAATLFAEGLSQAEIARRLSVSRTSVHYWYHAWKKFGIEGLKAIPDGRPSPITPEQWHKVEKRLLNNPYKEGFKIECWTLSEIAKVVKETAGVEYKTDAGLWKLLVSVGWACREPKYKFRKLTDAPFSHWHKVVNKNIKKNVD